MEYTLTQIRDNANMMVLTAGGLAQFRVRRRSDNLGVTAVPYCAGCRLTFADTTALAAAHTGVPITTYGAHTWGWWAAGAVDKETRLLGLLLTDG